MSQAGQQIIAIHILPNIWRSNTNQATKYGQFIEYNLRNIFVRSYIKNESERLVLDLFLFFRKTPQKL